eukprot:Colp12_sorted_trinity150504_noHs@23104
MGKKRISDYLPGSRRGSKIDGSSSEVISSTETLSSQGRRESVSESNESLSKLKPKFSIKSFRGNKDKGDKNGGDDLGDEDSSSKQVWEPIESSVSPQAEKHLRHYFSDNRMMKLEGIPGLMDAELFLAFRYGLKPGQVVDESKPHKEHAETATLSACSSLGSHFSTNTFEIESGAS